MLNTALFDPKDGPSGDPKDGASAHEHAPADACLRPILGALDWTGELRHLHEALPDGHHIADFEALCEVLERLKYEAVRLDLHAKALDEATLPGLLKRPDGDIWVLMRKPSPETFEIFAGRAGQVETVSVEDIRGEYHHVRPAKSETAARGQGRFGWISDLLARERSTVRLLFGLSFIINCFALTLPIYLMLVFDMAIGARSVPTLVTLAGVVLLIVAAEVGLRELRARAIGRFAVRTQIDVMRTVMERLLRMPVSYIESAPVAGQLNRLRSFESVRDIFSGLLATTILDLPFIFVFVLAVFAIGGALGWVLVGFIAAIAALVAVSVPRARARSHQAGMARAQTRLFRIDASRHGEVVRDTGAQDIWLSRYRDLISEQLRAGAAAQRINVTEQTVAQALSMVAGSLVVALGALKVMAGTLSVGALVALMAIVWRILSPIQTAFLNLNRLFQALDTTAQVNQLMQLPQESKSGEVRKFYRHVRGDIAVENVGFRYSPQGMPVLRGLDLFVKAGECVALTGEPGGGRGTLLKLIGAQYPPSLGRIRIDGSDMRQFDIRELRRAIALVNEEQVIFAGTLAENLLLANPLASEAGIHSAIASADLEDFVRDLPDGLETDLTNLMSDGLGTVIRQKIRLARAYVQSPSIYLLNQPAADLDPSGQEALLAKLQSLKGHATILISSSHEQILALADRTVNIGGGRVAAPALPSSKGTSLAPRSGNSAPKSLPHFHE